MSSEERRAVEQAKRFKTEGIGYFRHLSTKPKTAGYALCDSPAALATFIYEKFHSWSDNKGNPEDALSVTAMLDNISLYWLSRSGASASRFYWENPGNSFTGPKLDLPVAVSVFPREITKCREAGLRKLFQTWFIQRGRSWRAFCRNGAAGHF